ncbi:ATP-dependent RNA helicase DbpA [Salinimonas sp. HHU 13199]|uniref:ATP-dependent RNA helicase DbpA n=1 Tax=Salinimonas profundi TaxID=2729140 RepID=A0ABR8LMQ0_9ALTE|nr:ATP-dependent RNA helicase DbpA [Salinimonas profundi]MBD3586326.1 ATP-dependent RNA helicase DbpA [Salinimonas profundi]
MPQFSDLSLNAQISEALTSAGFTTMTQVQADTLPDSLSGKDVLVQASTGSGKTIAFAVAGLNKVDPTDYATQLLVICPTRELAEQVSQQIRLVGRQMPNLKVLTLCGGVAMGPQIQSLKHGASVVVATPGRLVEHVSKRRLALGAVKVRVLDEADRMLDMGFAEDIDLLFSLTPQHAQTLFFSATYTAAIEKQAQQYLDDPVTHRQAEEDVQRPDINELVYRVEDKHRLNALKGVLSEAQPQKAIVFCNTRVQVSSVYEALAQEGFAVKQLQGDLTQQQRNEVLMQFASDSLQVLIATDVAARGLDIKGVDCVINYTVSEDPEVHIHRIGRTGRAGEKGQAFTLCSEAEEPALGRIEQLKGENMERKGFQSLRFHANRIRTPEFSCIAVSAGKKQKLRPGDFLGSLTQDAQIEANDIGKISVQSQVSYIAVKQRSVKKAMRLFREGKIKGKRVRARKLQ